MSFGIESILVASGAGVSVVEPCFVVADGSHSRCGFLGAFQPILGTRQLALMLDRTFQTDEAIVTHLHLLETGRFLEEQPQVTEILASDCRIACCVGALSKPVSLSGRVRWPLVAAIVGFHSFVATAERRNGESIRTGDHSTTRPSR